MAETTRILITRNRPYGLTLTVKEPNSLTPIVFDPADTATMYITDKETGLLLLSVPMTQLDPANGVLKLTLADWQTSLLPYQKGYAEDGGKPISTCRGHVAINAVNIPVGYADVLLPDIYIADVGLADAQQPV